VHVRTVEIADDVCVVKTDVAAGVALTDVRAFTVMVMTAGLGTFTVTPLSVALTKRLTVPAVVPAVNATGFVTVELRDPMVGLLMDHEYVVPAGQVVVHVGVAVKGVEVAPAATDCVAGAIATAVSVPML
jgi:hypothetical protein